jgi:predicted DNA-binding transcriptional regulator YafY
MPRGRESKSASLNKMIRVLQTVNALAPQDAALDGKPVELARFAQLAGLSEKDCLRAIDKINYGCGDAVPAAWVEVDEQGRVVPHRLSFAFDGLMRLSRPEALALLVALRSSGADAGGHLASLVKGALPELDLARLDTVAGQQAMPVGALETLADAVARRQVVAFEYLDGRGTRTKRLVEPLEVWYDSNIPGWCVSAWCRLRQAVRTFRVDRMLDAPAPTGETFAERVGAQAEQGRIDQACSMQAVLAVHDPAVARKYTWPGMEELENPSQPQIAALTGPELARGGFIAQIPWVPGSAWLVQSIVASMGAVEALEPAELAHSVAALAEELLERLA